MLSIKNFSETTVQWVLYSGVLMLNRFVIWKLFGQILTQWSQDLCFHVLCPTFSWVKMALMIYKASLDSTNAPGGSPPAGRGPTGFAAGWKHSRTKSRICMFFLFIHLSQRGHWRSIWPAAVLQPDHRHKLTTCVLVHKPDKLCQLRVTLRFPRHGLYWKEANGKCSCDQILSLTVVHRCLSLNWVKHSLFWTICRSIPTVLRVDSTYEVC